MDAAGDAGGDGDKAAGGGEVAELPSGKPPRRPRMRGGQHPPESYKTWERLVCIRINFIIFVVWPVWRGWSLQLLYVKSWVLALLVAVVFLPGRCAVPTT